MIASQGEAIVRVATWLNVARLGVVCALVLCGCPGGGGGAASEAEIAAYRQRLELTVDGAAVEVPLERLDVYLVEDESFPEVFELQGAAVILVGELPVHVGYGEEWQQLLGKRVTIASEGGDPREPKHSQVTLPGASQPTRVQGGWFQVDSHRPGFDAKTPLEGRLELQLEDGRTLQGKLFVLGTTWG